MLLGSPPDMVHNVRLRETRSSTRKHLLRAASLRPSKKGSTPAIADFRCRAPLLPRLVWPYFTAYLIYYSRFPLILQEGRKIFVGNISTQNAFSLKSGDSPTNGVRFSEKGLICKSTAPRGGCGAKRRAAGASAVIQIFGLIAGLAGHLDAQFFQGIDIVLRQDH